jgi:hypothetical protein
MTGQNGNVYVTYKWLIVQTIAVLILLIPIVFIIVSSKVDKELYRVEHAQLCVDIGSIKTTVDINQKELTSIGKNQLLVLRALKIQPVASDNK